MPQQWKIGVSSSLIKQDCLNLLMLHDKDQTVSNQCLVQNFNLHSNSYKVKSFSSQEKILNTATRLIITKHGKFNLEDHRYLQKKTKNKIKYITK